MTVVKGKNVFMRTIICLVGVVLAGLCLNGCKKSAEPAAETPTAQAINATEFRPAFASASPQTKAVVDQVMMDIQASLYPGALNDLAKLAANPALTETQKKVVGDLTDQLKKKMAAIATPPK